MVKRKSRRRSKFPGNRSSVPLNSDEEDDRREKDPDPSSRSYVYDEIDEFHANREKILLDSGRRIDGSDESDAEHAVYDLSDVDDFDDEDVGNNQYMNVIASKNEQEMASDVEDEEKGLPDVKAWGIKPSIYYNTDYVDKDYDQYDASDEEMAEAEEQEAMALQKRLVEQMDDQDFGIGLFNAAKVAPDMTKERIERDLTSMSKQEKLEVLKMESPELLIMIDDFRAKLLLIRDKIQPLVDLVDKGEIPIGPGTDYLHVKHDLLLNYCTNVCFYLMMKAERKRTNNHPIITRLVSYRNLLKELEPIDKHMEGDMEAILECLSSGNKVSSVVERIGRQVESKGKRQLKAMVKWHQNSSVPNKDDDDVMSSVREEKTTKQKKKGLETRDELNALQMYSMMKAGRKQAHIASEIDEFTNLSDSSESDADEQEDGDEQPQIVEGDKRAISYEIAKNKGLKQYRKKLNRNPRVKNKLKFRRAKIRRKGQVQEVRKELNKYAGEISGIKATSSRSIKIR